MLKFTSAGVEKRCCRDTIWGRVHNILAVPFLCLFEVNPTGQSGFIKVIKVENGAKQELSIHQGTLKSFFFESINQNGSEI